MPVLVDNETGKKRDADAGPWKGVAPCYAHVRSVLISVLPAHAKIASADTTGPAAGGRLPAPYSTLAANTDG